MKRLLLILGAGVAPLLLSNCTVGTPQSRIDRNYSLYESLPPKHQELVHQGRVTKGMSKSAVFLALGSPSRKSEGFRDDAHFERWDYTRLQPHYYHTFHTGYGTGWGHRGHRSHYHGFGYGTAVDYVPYRASTILFRRGLVDSWEKLGPPSY